jgi:hypothetical protein
MDLLIRRKQTKWDRWIDDVELSFDEVTVISPANKCQSTPVTIIMFNLWGRKFSFSETGEPGASAMPLDLNRVQWDHVLPVAGFVGTVLSTRKKTTPPFFSVVIRRTSFWDS